MTPEQKYATLLNYVRDVAKPTGKRPEPGQEPEWGDSAGWGNSDDSEQLGARIQELYEADRAAQVLAMVEESVDAV